MKLSIKNLENTNSKHFKLPTYNIEEVHNKTKQFPKWVHFGVGNIFRGFISFLQDNLIKSGFDDIGIIAVESFDFEIIEKIYKPFDNLSMLVTLNNNGKTKYEISAAIADALTTQANDWIQLVKYFTNETLQISSLTVTEKGYQLTNNNGEYLQIIKDDIKNGPSKCYHLMSILTSLLYERYKSNQKALALVSLDNMSENGNKFKQAILAIAEEWKKLNHVTQEFLDYINNEDKISFPWTMIDKIVPRPNPVIANQLIEFGLENMNPITTSKGTFIAPFVNAEKIQYLVIEDKFPNGRPSLEKSGVYFTSKKIVDQVEKLKVTTCLNPLHTALAVVGCLLGYDKIYEEVQNKHLLELIKQIGYNEGLKVVENPKIINPKKFIDEVIYKRLPNPFVPDTPQRIATDTSLKVGIRFGVTIKAYAENPQLSISSLIGIPFAIAAWLRYLLGYDDEWNTMSISSDPNLEYLQSHLQGITLGDTNSVSNKLETILSNKNIFGIDLVEINLSNAIINLFKKMIAEKHSVRETLERLF